MKMRPAMLFIVVFCQFPLAAVGLELFVSPTAGDGGDGSQERPFGKIEKARDHLRDLRKSGELQANTAVTVRLLAGVYHLEKSLVFSKEDGGTAQAPVSYVAEKKGAASLRGGFTLATDGVGSGYSFRKLKDEAILSRLPESARGKVLVSDLSKLVPGEFPRFPKSYRTNPVGPWLYVDGEPQTLARWPNVSSENQGWAIFTKVVDNGLPPADENAKKSKPHPGAFVFENNRLKRWKMKDGVWLFGYWTHDWSDEVIQIANYDAEKKVIRLAAPHHYGLKNNTWGRDERRFYALNLLEELDEPGEWYLDRADKKLYYYPKGELRGKNVILATLSEPLVQMKQLSHFKLIGLKLEYGHDTGLKGQDLEAVEILACEFSNLASTGMSISGSRNIVRSCDFYHLGRGGISVTGGDRKLLKKAENRIENNHIHHYGLFQRTYTPGISVSGCGQIVRHNLLHHAPHNAIGYSGNEHLFELNEIHHVVMETGDASAFYTGRDWTSHGNVIRHNFIHQLGAEGSGDHVMGVYLDDCDSGDLVEGNVFYRTGRAVLLGGGRENIFRRNIIIESPIGIHFDSRGMKWKQWNSPDHAGWHFEEKAKQLNYQSPPWSDHYPLLAKIMEDSPKEPLYNVFQQNIFINCGQIMRLDSEAREIMKKLDVAQNLVVNSAKQPTKLDGIQDHPGFSFALEMPETDLKGSFADYENLDFTLKKNSAILKLLPDFQPIPFDEIGLKIDRLRPTLP